MDDVPVVLVHGFASSYERNWREPGWADLLRDEGRQAIGVDLPGHGQAARPRDPAAYSSLEQSIIAAMPGTGQVDAVGFSLGAQVLLRAAAVAPATASSPAPMRSPRPGPSRPGRPMRRPARWPRRWPTSQARRETTGPRWPRACAGRILR